MTSSPPPARSARLPPRWGGWRASSRLISLPADVRRCNRFAVVAYAPHPPAGTFSPLAGRRDKRHRAGRPLSPFRRGPKDGQRHAALPRQVRVSGGREGRTLPSSVMPGSPRHPAARCPSRGETSSSAWRWVLSARRRSPAGCRIRSGMTEAARSLLPLPHRGGDRPVAGIPCTADLRARGERRAGFTLPLRGRVGPQVRGGVIRDVVTPTRAFRATSPLKGEVGGPRRGSSLCPAAAHLTRSAPAPCRRGHGSPALLPACSAVRCRHRRPSPRRDS